MRIDCDVIQADGGTRTASITGSCIALADALSTIKGPSSMRQLVGSVSVGIHNGQPILDLEYVEDSQAETDMNVVMTEDGNFIEVQGTAEGVAFSRDELGQMLDLSEHGIRQLFEIQRVALNG